MEAQHPDEAHPCCWQAGREQEEWSGRGDLPQPHLPHTGERHLALDQAGGRVVRRRAQR